MRFSTKLVILLCMLAVILFIIGVPKVKAQTVVIQIPPVVIPCTPFTPCYINAYNYCVEQCLETYANMDLTYACEQYCQANPQVVVVIPNNGWFGRGQYIPRGGHYPRDGRHDRGERHDQYNHGRR